MGVLIFLKLLLQFDEFLKALGIELVSLNKEKTMYLCSNGTTLMLTHGQSYKQLLTYEYNFIDVEEASKIYPNTTLKIPYVIKPRRPGDIATCYSDATLAKEELGWEAEFGIRQMCEDSWRWQKNNPNGYED